MEHRKIEFGLGNIESAVKELARYKERGELVYGEFNGQKLYSDTDDLDSASSNSALVKPVIFL